MWDQLFIILRRKDEGCTWDIHGNQGRRKSCKPCEMRYAGSWRDGCRNRLWFADVTTTGTDINAAATCQADEVRLNTSCTALNPTNHLQGKSEFLSAPVRGKPLSKNCLNLAQNPWLCAAFSGTPIVHLGLNAGRDTFFLPVKIFNAPTGPNPRPPKCFKGTEQNQELLKTQAHIFGLKEAEEGIKAGIWSPPSWAPQWMSLWIFISGPGQKFNPVNLRNLSQTTERWHQKHHGFKILCFITLNSLVQNSHGYLLTKHIIPLIALM